MASRTDEQYHQLYRDSLSNNEDHIVEILTNGHLDTLFTSKVHPKVFTKDEMRDLRSQFKSRSDGAKEILRRVRAKDNLGIYISFSRALCFDRRFDKRLFPFIADLEQEGRHPALRISLGAQPAAAPIARVDIDRSSILWVVESRAHYETTLSTQSGRASPLKTTAGFELTAVEMSVPYCPGSDDSECFSTPVTMATPTSTADYRKLFTAIRPKPKLVIFTCTGKPLGGVSSDDVIVVRRTNPTITCCEVEQMTTLWSLYSRHCTDFTSNSNILYGRGTNKSSHENPEVLVSSGSLVNFYNAADREISDVATIAVAGLKDTDQSCLDYSLRIVEHFARKYHIE